MLVRHAVAQRSEGVSQRYAPQDSAGLATHDGTHSDTMPPGTGEHTYPARQSAREAQVRMQSRPRFDATHTPVAPQSPVDAHP
jgi:hypothetical protein